MAKKPSDKENAVNFVRLLVHHFKLPPGTIHNNRNSGIQTEWEKKYGDADDLARGMDHAIDEGWVEETHPRGFKLTESGFEMA